MRKSTEVNCSLDLNENVICVKGDNLRDVDFEISKSDKWINVTCRSLPMKNAANTNGVIINNARRRYAMIGCSNPAPIMVEAINELAIIPAQNNTSTKF